MRASQSPRHDQRRGRFVWFSLMMAIATVDPLLAQTPGFVFQPELTTDRVQTTLLEVRLAERQPATGLVAATIVNADRTSSLANRVVYLHDVRLVTNNDVAEAHVVGERVPFAVALTLTPEGTQQLAAAAVAHDGKPLAIIVNGEIVAAPSVRLPIGRQLLISGNFSRAQAERIARGLTR
jgi:preprotein translocase subunit SecD